METTHHKMPEMILTIWKCDMSPNQKLKGKGQKLNQCLLKQERSKPYEISMEMRMIEQQISYFTYTNVKEIGALTLRQEITPRTINIINDFMCACKFVQNRMDHYLLGIECDNWTNHFQLWSYTHGTLLHTQWIWTLATNEFSQCEK